MKKEEIQPWDWQRILFGQAPAEFLLEVFIRTVLIYLVLLLVLRILGKRMDGQLTLTEMSVMVTLGAIVSVPMQIPDRGLLMGVVALSCVLAFQRGWNWLTVKNEAIEKISQGTHSILVKDGIIQLDELQKTALSKQHLFAALRQKMVFNLGSVKRVYFEACGIFSIYMNGNNTPGLPVFPSSEVEVMKSQAKIVNDLRACKSCGNIANISEAEKPCKVCRAGDWMEAVV